MVYIWSYKIKYCFLLMYKIIVGRSGRGKKLLLEFFK